MYCPNVSVDHSDTMIPGIEPGTEGTVHNLAVPLNNLAMLSPKLMPAPQFPKL